MRSATALLVLSLVAPAAVADGWEGRPLPRPKLEKISNTPARSFDDFVGRTVLVEFFAYW